MLATKPKVLFAVVLATTVALAVASLLVGTSEVSIKDLVSGDPAAYQVVFTSRVPRTLAIIFTGASIGIAGLIVQMLSRNRFVEPSTIGTTEAAILGILLITYYAPDADVTVKLLAGIATALLGTALFFALIRQQKHRSGLIIPLIGLVLTAIISSFSFFFATQNNLLPLLNSRAAGSFSQIVTGRWEMLLVLGVITVLIYALAVPLTIVGVGESFAKSLGVNVTAVMALGLSMVALTSATTVVVVGAIPFLGLVVPNLVTIMVGDNLKRNIPWIALGGVAILLACDLLSRLIRFPYEIPVALIMGILGGLTFIILVLRRRTSG